MPTSDFIKEITSSDEFAQYSLRATFFVSKLRQLKLHEAIQEVHQLTKVKSSFRWPPPPGLGVREEAWERVKGKGLEPLLLFCHPRVLSEQPPLLLYYRTLALLSQKGLASLVGGNIAAIESGRVEKLDPAWTKRCATALNSVMSVILATAADIEARDLRGMQFASAGATIQGAWNNAVGLAGETAVKTILVNHLRGEIVQIVWRDGTTSEYSSKLHSSLIDRINCVRVVRLKRGYHIFFSNEPDVSLRDAQDVPQLAIEVKAGADPAGALERLGAAMKSFDNEKNLNPRVRTVYVVRSITPELHRRISQANPFDYTFALSELLADERTQKTFANLILRCMIGR